MQRGLLLGLTVLMIVVGLTGLLLGRRHTLETRRRDGLLLDVIANISSGLDRLDGGLDDIVAQTKIARNRLRQLIVIHRENLLVCAMLNEKRKQKKQLIRRRRRRRRRRRFAVIRDDRYNRDQKRLLS